MVIQERESVPVTVAEERESVPVTVAEERAWLSPVRESWSRLSFFFAREKNVLEVVESLRARE